VILKIYQSMVVE